MWVTDGSRNVFERDMIWECVQKNDWGMQRSWYCTGMAIDVIKVCVYDSVKSILGNCHSTST